MSSSDSFRGELVKFLINIQTDSELIGYEALALAFLLASFDHPVQLSFSGASATLLADPKSRVYGMIQSLDLYDLPPAISLLDDVDRLDSQIIGAFNLDAKINYSDYDSVLNF